MRAPLAIALVTTLACQATRIPGGAATPVGIVDASYSGIVVDRTNGKPIHSAGVVLTPVQNAELNSVSAFTNTDGKFQMLRVPPGQYVVEVSARGFKPEKTTMRFSPKQARSHELTLAPVGAECPTLKVGRPLPGCR